MRPTISDALIKAAECLDPVANKNAPIDAEIILSVVLNTSREWLLTHDSKLLSPAQTKAFIRIVSRRAKGRPLAYCLGYQNFYGFKFLVKPGVLIPRPDSELLIELALSKFGSRKLLVADIGTGSGCLGITLAHARSNWKILAVDKSPAALTVAHNNAILNKVFNRMKFRRGDLLAPLLSSPIDLIIANLPYLTPKEIKNEPTIKYEPRLALTGGSNGLQPYDKLFRQYRRQQRTCPLLLEIDPRRKSALTRLTHQLLPNHKMTWHRDLNDKWRVLELHIGESENVFLALHRDDAGEGFPYRNRIDSIGDSSTSA